MFSRLLLASILCASAPAVAAGPNPDHATWVQPTHRLIEGDGVTAELYVRNDGRVVARLSGPNAEALYQAAEDGKSKGGFFDKLLEGAKGLVSDLIGDVKVNITVSVASGGGDAIAISDGQALGETGGQDRTDGPASGDPAGAGDAGGTDPS